MKEISFAAAVKFGVGPWGEGELPAELKEELEERHFKIQMATTGRYHFHRGSLNTEDIQTFWDRRNNMENGEQWSQWCFYNHRSGKSATVRAGRFQTGPEICEFLLLEPAVSINVDFSFESVGNNSARVTFYGQYSPISEGATPVNFNSSFLFIQSISNSKYVDNFNFFYNKHKKRRLNKTMTNFVTVRWQVNN